jgi:hypothetical protein
MSHRTTDYMGEMGSAMSQPNSSTRACYLACTIADLATSKQIQTVHVAEALQYRPKLTTASRYSTFNSLDFMQVLLGMLFRKYSPHAIDACELGMLD